MSDIVEYSVLGEEYKRIRSACLRDREFQRACTDETRTRRAIIDGYLADDITRSRAAELLVTKCHYGPQGAVEALNYAFQHRRPS